MLDVRQRLFDAGRIIPDGQRESFTTAARGDVTIVVRTDSSEAIVTVSSAGSSDTLTNVPDVGGWLERRARIRSSGTITLAPRGGSLRDFHVWIIR